MSHCEVAKKLDRGARRKSRRQLDSTKRSILDEMTEKIVDATERIVDATERIVDVAGQKTQPAENSSTVPDKSRRDLKKR